VGAAKIDYAGDVGVSEFPDFKYTTNFTYSQGALTAFLQFRYIGAGLLDARDIEGVTIDRNHVDSVLYTDARVSWGKETGGHRWQIFGSVTNLFDTDPPVVAMFSSFTGQASQTNANIHDILGRRFTVGFSYDL
jgi:iron complex outermembrane recepter protein